MVFKSKYYFRIVEISAPEGYPWYLSYKLDQDRLDNLKTISDGMLLTHYDIEGEEIYTQEEELKNNFYERTFSHSNLASEMTIAVFSDGVASFYDEKNREPISPIEVIKEFMDFKSTKGKFVERRVNKTLKRMRKRGLGYHDDISMGAVHYFEKSE